MVDTSTATSIISTFDVNAEGWAMQGDVTTFAWEPTGGNPGGHLNWTDAAVGNVCFYIAPEEFRGDKSAYYGGLLSFDLQDTAGANFEDRDLILTGGGLTIVYDFATPGTSWTHYAIGLDAAAGWKVGTLAGPAATEAQIRQVLGALDQLLIRAEFVTGFEEGDLDNVILSTSGAPGHTWERFTSPAQTTLEGVFGSFAQSLVTATAGDVIVFVNPPATALGLGNQAVGIDNLTVQADGTLDAVFQLGAGVVSFTLAGATNADVTGNGNANVITGSDGDNVLQGLGGNDTLNGGGGDDTLEGGAGNDAYSVTDTGDTITEGLNQGYDTVNTTLNAFMLGANVERVNFVSIGNFVGTGNSLANRFQGGAGNDRFIDVAGGADIFSGGLGTDIVDFRASASGATINLATLVHGGAAAGDSYSSIERYWGSNTAGDTMTGDGSKNSFYGFAGDDTLSGGGQADRLEGGAGNDTLDGGTSKDVLNGGANNDTLTGGADLDYFEFSALGFGNDTVTDFVDGVDKLKVFAAGVADDVSDFTILGQGTSSVLVTLIADGSTVTLNGAANITISNTDFVFY